MFFTSRVHTETFGRTDILLLTNDISKIFEKCKFDMKLLKKKHSMLNHEKSLKNSLAFQSCAEPVILFSIIYLFIPHLTIPYHTTPHYSTPNHMHVRIFQNPKSDLHVFLSKTAVKNMSFSSINWSEMKPFDW